MSRLFARHGDDDMEMPYDASRHGPDNRPPSAERMAAMLHHDNWYTMQRYENRTTWVLLALIAFLAVGPGLLRRLRVAEPRLASQLVSRLPGYYALAAFCRRIGYVELGHVGFGLRMPALGAALVIVVFSAGMFVWSLVVKPWYRPSREWGSPPLAIRTAMIANALIPFLFALSMKVNVISFLTALSHERLQVYHQWMARLVLLLSVMHTIPFIWQPLHDAGYENLKAWWDSDAVTNWSGVAALAIMAWMVASSTRVFRNMSYEFFVIQHILSAVSFLGLYFWHTANGLNSWIWLWATVGIWGLATLLKWSRSAAASQYFVNMRASVEVGRAELGAGGGEVVRIALRTPVKWAPGSHVFVRFPTLAPLQSHPWTIVTLSSPSPHADSQLVLVARVRGGITRVLHSHVETHATDDEETLLRADDDDGEQGGKMRTSACLVPAIIDGPYGASSAVVQAFDEVVMLIGGMGITYALPTLMHLASARSIVTRHVSLVWTVRDAGLMAWFAEYLDSISERFASSAITFAFELHLTGAAQASLAGDGEKLRHCTRRVGRPNGAARVAQAAQEARSRRASSLALLVCGPQGLADDVANATARLQGERRGLKEVYLLKEHYSW